MRVPRAPHPRGSHLQVNLVTELVFLMEPLCVGFTMGGF